MNRLLDHRRFAVATAVVVAVLDVLLVAGAFALSRGRAVAPGLAIGGALALGDILLLSRSLDRLAGRSGEVGSRAVTAMLMGRFASVAMIIGIAVCARGINPVAVFVGFLLLPLAIGIVGAASLHSGAGGSEGRLGDAAG